MSTTFRFLNDLSRKVDDYVTNNLTPVSATCLGLDMRAGYRFYIDEDCIVVTDASNAALRYYGGFEYVRQENVRRAGDYVFYFRDRDDDYCRVSEHLRINYYGRVQANEDEEACA